MLKAILIIVAIIIVGIGLFAIRQFISVNRGARRRDETLIQRLDPLMSKLEAREAVSSREITALASQPELRHILFFVLRQHNRPDLLPTDCLSSESQGESAHAYWMMRPHELQDAPEEIEFVETVWRPVDEHESAFHVYRYRMSEGHWAADDGWQLGLAGPMDPDAEPYADRPGAFARCGDIHGKVQPAELIDWYVGMLRKKGMIE